MPRPRPRPKAGAPPGISPRPENCGRHPSTHAGTITESVRTHSNRKPAVSALNIAPQEVMFCYVIIVRNESDTQVSVLLCPHHIY